MAIPLGGLESPYMHGISIVLLVRAVMLPDHWHRALPVFAAIVLTFPTVMGIGSAISPAARAEWLDRDTLVNFVANFVFVIASATVGLVSGHAVWAARQQLYRARRLGRYRLQAPIGRGGMAEVWLAWDQSLQRNVALKFLRTGGTPSPEAVRRFEREAQAASQMRIPHAVQIYDFGASEDGILYIAMEFLRGMDLEKLVLRHGVLPPGRVVHFALQICDGLEEAHAAGIIHRDVKPQNLFVTRMGAEPDYLKLLDFGIARLRTEDAEPHLTRTGMVFGTPAFVAPEVWEGAEADERSDIYAVGVTLYFLLTGELPYEGATPSAVQRARAAGTAVPPSARRPGLVPAGLDAVVLGCLKVRPDDRFQSVAELRRALMEIGDAARWTAADAEEFWGRAGEG
jgi:serine/threonine-protein kinase